MEKIIVERTGLRNFEFQGEKLAGRKEETGTGRWS